MALDTVGLQSRSHAHISPPLGSSPIPSLGFTYLVQGYRDNTFLDLERRLTVQLDIHPCITDKANLVLCHPSQVLQVAIVAAVGERVVSCAVVKMGQDDRSSCCVSATDTSL